MNPALPIQNSSRVSKLRKRFLDVLSGSVKFDPRGATLFLEGLRTQEDPAVCLDGITASAHGLPSVQSAMQFDLSVQFMNGLGSTVLEYLLRASNVGGDALDNLLFHVVEPPIFWGVFVRTFQQGALSEDAQLVFARVLSRLLTLQNRDTTPYRAIAAQPLILDNLLASSRHEIREIGHLIRHILSSASSLTVYDILAGPGGRHDNDFSDYRDISILPTAEEILSRQPPFLRTAFHDELSASESPVKDYLDNTFRMLREDMLFDIREQVQVVSQKKGKHRGPRVIGCVSMIGVYTGTVDRKTRWGIKLQCNTDFKELKKIKDSGARLNFLALDPRGSRILRHQSLVCLASGKDIISFGTVNRVEELLASKPPVIVLQLDGAVNIRKTLASLCVTKNVRLIQLDAATFSFEPVLTALQNMGSVPLVKEIILWDPEMPIAAFQNSVALSHIANAVTSNLSVDLRNLLDLPTSICLDKSQARSLVAGLTKRVSLIQGPPGTGKSFIGTILAKAIHDKTSQTILVVCYTNHALDQFLGDLLKYNIPAGSMVRLGGRANQSIEHLSLHKQPRGRFRYDWDEITQLKSTASHQEDKLQTHFRTLLTINDHKNLMTHLELQHRDFFEAFYVPLETEDGMTRVGRNGQAIDDEYLFSQWIRGLDAGVLSDDPHVQASARVWGMDHSARQQRLAEWQHELITKKTEPICQVGLEYNKLQDTIKQEFGESTVAILRQKRIIACTTTGAAIYAQAIQKVGPKFLLVEEAGEILESHVLTALSRKVNQMILIGDHKQLRPKVNNYQLTIEKGEGFELNQSLFERLVLKGYPHETLSTQHRMRPEISAFVRELTYPELIDAPSTNQRPDVCGVHSNVIFVDHSHPEDDDSLIGDRADSGAKSSKKNTYEVQMVLKIVRYLAQQGYKSENIVILTPYLGQLHQLRDALKRDNDPILNDLDSLDLARAGIPTSSPSELKAKKGRIHLATIDNYQGEESDIVVASLTRSNKSNAIGFMDSPERLNVLLSRARDGLILIGNSQTFLNSKKGGALWRQFFALLDNAQYVYQGFPAKCERHPERVVLLKRASDFDNLCPDGGCTEVCGFTLPCGHICPMKCHPRRPSALFDLHDVSQCGQKMSTMCPAGHHRIAWECRFGPPDCSTCMEEAERLAEIARQALEQQRRREEAEAEHRRQIAEMEAKLRAEEMAQKERELQEERKKQEEERRREAERKRQEEEKRQREEKKRKQEENKRKREENKKKREENKKKQQQENKKKQEEKRRKREEKKRKREEKARQVQEATRQRQEEERRRQEEQTRMREEQTRRLQEATRRRLEEEERERQEEHKRKREEDITRIRVATRQRQEGRFDNSAGVKSEAGRLGVTAQHWQAFEQWRETVEVGAKPRAEEERKLRGEQHQHEGALTTRMEEEHKRQMEAKTKQEEAERKREEKKKKREERKKRKEDKKEEERKRKREGRPQRKPKETTDKYWELYPGWQEAIVARPWTHYS